MKHLSFLPIAAAVVVIAGCKTAPMPLADSSLATVSAIQAAPAAALTLASSLERAVSQDGMAHMLVSMNVRQQPALGFKVQQAATLPTAWSQAAVSLFSPSVSAAYDVNLHSRTLIKTAFTDNGNGTFTGRFTFPPLRPAADYQARVFVGDAQAGADRLAGSMVQDNVALVAGTNPLSFDVVVNDQQNSFQAQVSATSANKIDGSNITKDDLVSLKTGLAKNQPGVTRLDVKLTGACYGNGTDVVLLKSFAAADAASWDAFTWNTDADQADFLKAQFKGGTDVNAADGKLIFEAYNERNELVGKSELAIHVFGRPVIDVTLH
jgi:hypothetical protein